jgi:trimethylamine---corrinoid protein Co-methyltransferase
LKDGIQEVLTVAKFSFASQPSLRLLTAAQVEDLHARALVVLETAGVKFESEEALKILADHGARVDFAGRTARIKPEMVMDALARAPEKVELYDREGRPAAVLGGNKVHFDPGSAAIKFMESDGITVRKSAARDLVQISRVNDALEHIALQSTAVTLYDVPKLIGDSYRLYLLLKNSPKPIITGAFSVHGVANMRDMLAAVRGGSEELREKPLAVFDICPSPPLKWTPISSQNIIDCARFGLPIETVSMSMPGAAGPATLAGSLLVNLAETLSGMVLAQCVNPGTPFIYGGAPAQFDMRFGTTALSAIEATMIAAAYAQMGKYYGLPTHTYAALSDAKTVDAQAGLETGMSGIVAALAGINVISGPGILDFVSCISLEKLVIDNEVCGMALRLNRGIDCSDEFLALDLICRLGPGGNYMPEEHTFKWFRKEPYIPSAIIDRRDRTGWAEDGSRNIFQRAGEKVRQLLAEHQPPALDSQREERLDRVVRGILADRRIGDLPFGPG